MVFMSDSARSASLALEAKMPVGLHFNLTEAFTADHVSETARAAQNRTRRFLRASKYALLIYNPFLRHDFIRAFRSQYSEFERLYGRAPTHIDGHQHMHLSMNVLFQHLLPLGAKVRRSFSFAASEKGFLNRSYRTLVDRKLAKRHVLTDWFFALKINLDILNRILGISRASDVELMVHPERNQECEFLLSKDFSDSIADVKLGAYSDLPLFL
jgi:predicted glycoside hydrolase/deacetylase ChbG (UPF0249 family)